MAVKPKKPGRPTSVNIKRLSMPRPTSRAFKFHDLPFFDEEDEDTDELILTNENGVTIVKAGTVDKLIARLTYEKHPGTPAHALAPIDCRMLAAHEDRSSLPPPDPSYLSAFLLTYQSFTTPGYLLDKLIERYPFCGIVPVVVCRRVSWWCIASRFMTICFLDRPLARSTSSHRRAPPQNMWSYLSRRRRHLYRQGRPSVRSFVRSFRISASHIRPAADHGVTRSFVRMVQNM